MMHQWTFLRATAVGALALFAAGTTFPGAAKADLVLINATTGAPATSVAASFTDLGAQGFGNAPRLLTTGNAGPKEELIGSGTPLNQANGDAATGANKTSTPTLSALGWNNGGQVGIGFNSDQSGQTGLTLNDVRLTIYDATAAGCIFGGLGPTGCAAHALGSFDLAQSLHGLTFTAADLKLQQGNGNAVFGFGLTDTEVAEFNTIRAFAGSSNFFAGLSADIGCPTPTPTGCLVANDGPDSWLGFVRVPGPVVGAGLPGLIMACGGLLGLARRRQQKIA